MAKRISILVALEGADEGLKRAITSAERSLGELSTTAKTAGAKAAAGMAEVKAGMSAFGDQVATAKTQLLAFLSINWAEGAGDRPDRRRLEHDVRAPEAGDGGPA